MWYLPLQDTDMLVLVLPTGRADYFGHSLKPGSARCRPGSPWADSGGGQGRPSAGEKDWRRQNDAIVLLPDPMGWCQGHARRQHWNRA